MLTGKKPREISDRDMNILVRAEERFRRQWARELGFDPGKVDLYALPPVAPFSDVDTEAA